MKSLIERILHRLKPGSNFFLRQAKGLIHVGAHLGQERDLYAEDDVTVVWVEANPAIFSILAENIKKYPRQRAVSALVTDVDGKDYPFHIGGDDGASSSILELGRRQELWPEVTTSKTITLQSITLPSLIQRENLDLSNYDALVMDTQGTELLVLKGAEPILKGFKFIRAEAADFEAYQGCCQLSDLDSFLGARGFRRARTTQFAYKEGVGAYYDAVYASVS